MYQTIYTNLQKGHIIISAMFLKTEVPYYCFFSETAYTPLQKHTFPNHCCGFVWKIYTGLQKSLLVLCYSVGLPTLTSQKNRPLVIPCCFFLRQPTLTSKRIPIAAMTLPETTYTHLQKSPYCCCGFAWPWWMPGTEMYEVHALSQLQTFVGTGNTITFFSTN